MPPKKNKPGGQPSEQMKPPLGSRPGFPALHKAPKNKYEEEQDEEIQALQAIFGEDFERVDVEGAGAWKKREPCFTIRARSTEGPQSVVLKVQMTATYPKSVPLLSISEDEDLRETTRDKIKNILEKKSQDLINAGPIVYNLVDLIVEVLDEAANVQTGGLPSLEAERTTRESEAAALAIASGAEERKRKELETMEKDRFIEDEIQIELNKRTKTDEERRKDRRGSAANTTAKSEELLSERVTFDQRISLTDAQNNIIQFQSVTNKFEIRRGPVACIYTVRPVVIGSSVIPTMILKQTTLKDTTSDSKFKDHMYELESELNKVKNIKHCNVLQLYDFKIDKNSKIEDDNYGPKEAKDPSWTVSILMEYANKGSLEEILEVAGDLQISKVRAWTIDLLGGLRFLHDQGIVHQDIQASNVLLVRDHQGEITAKLADAGYQRRLNILGDKKKGNSKVQSVSKSAYWFAPENLNAEKPVYNQKTDVWDFGVVFLNMIFGMDVVLDNSSPTQFAQDMNLSPSLYEFVQKIFTADPRKRPRAYELSSFEFLATDAEVHATETPPTSSRPSISSVYPATPFRQRHNSASNDHGGIFASRYKQDFFEETRLGKGGFGEVMKVRKKLDGQFYAVKKIVQRRSSSTMTEILKEVRVLSQLSHPYVVRYYGTWTEEIGADGSNEEAVTSGEDSSSDSDDISPGGHPRLDFGVSTTGDIDYIGSAHESNIIFADDSGDDEDDEDYDGGEGSDDDDEDEDDDDEGDNDEKDEYGEDGEDETTSIDEQVDRNHKLFKHRTLSNPPIQKSTRTILYIQMEYCAGRTLRDLIRGGLYKNKDEVWRLFRQILESLVYIHGMNVVHRDLKPENVFMDSAENVRIGDFGLATSGQFSAADKQHAHLGQTDMTRSVGTALYVAPEVRSTATGTYTAKVDMYSLGIIFFEMCYEPVIGHERADKVGRLREKEPQLPKDFDKEKKSESEIILELLRHEPKDRPSSSELLSGGKLPDSMEKEQIRQTVAKLADSDSEGYTHIVNTLLSMPNKPARDFAWDMTSSKAVEGGELLFQNIVAEQMASIFRHHGALETQRAFFFPRSKYYSDNIVKLLDTSGLVMQLPWDLTLPNARALAKHTTPVLRSFTFGEVYRSPRHVGGQPTAVPTIGFDIVSTDTKDFAMKEAEVIKVVDEIVQNFPALDAKKFSFRLNHANLLGLIFQFCRIERSSHDEVAEILSRLNVQWSWTKIRVELRGLGVSSTSIDDLLQFDFQDPPQIAARKLQDIFQGSEMLENVSSAMGHLNDVAVFLNRFQVQSKCFVSPLSSINQKFYKGAMMFMCMKQTKGNNKEVFAAGGRYDSLIREHRGTVSGKSTEYHAVGFNLSWIRIATYISDLQKATGKHYLKKQEELNGVWQTRRCDVLVACFDPSTLRSEGAELVAKLWAHDISAELAVDARSPEDLLSKYAKDPHCWLVIIKQESMLKVKSLVRKDRQDEDVSTSQLISHLRAEIRDRDQHNGTYEKTQTQRYGGQVESATTGNHNADVRLLLAEKKSKKTNRLNIVEQAQEKAAALANSFLEGPIVAVETTDKILNMIKETRLCDADSWRNVVQKSPIDERSYIKRIQTLLEELATENKSSSRNAFVYNFRTGACIYYDLGADTSSHPVGKGKDRESGH